MVKFPGLACFFALSIPCVAGQPQSHALTDWTPDLLRIANANQPATELKQWATTNALAKVEDESRTWLSRYVDHLTVSIQSVKSAQPEFEIIGVNGYDRAGQDKRYLFSQLGLNGYDGRTTLNLGLGVRQLNATETWLVGANAFYDHEFPYNHQRYSAGIEVRSAIAKLASNVYGGLSDFKGDEGGVEAKALGGRDVKLELAFPYLPGLWLSYTEFLWKGVEGASNSQGSTLSVKGQLSPNLTLELGRRNYDSQTVQDRNMATLTYAYGFGENHPPTLFTLAETAYRLTPLDGVRYAPVERENRIIKQRKFSATVSGF